MRKFKELNQSEGFTLIEILASIVILGIILITFLSFFSQSMLFSSKVEQNLSAVNIADRVLYEFKENIDASSLVKQSCPGTTQTSLTFLPQDHTGQHYYEVNSQKYYPTIIICQTNDEEQLNLYRTHVQIFDKDSKLLSELTDYIK